MDNFQKTLIFGTSLLLALMVVTRAGATSHDTVADRIAPIGQVKVAGAADSSEQAKAEGAKVETTSASTDVAAAAPSEEDGEAIYNKYCVACHAAGVAGAPKLGDKAAWEPRIKAGNLLEHVVNGLNAMPPKGTCMTCSDEQLQQAIDYMTASVK